MVNLGIIISMRPEFLLTQKIYDYSTIYIDMDSFFASVEQFYNPELRDKPVGIATGTTKNASIIAASYDAKRKGIYTGIKVGKAMLVCPDIKIVYDSPNSYRKVHREIMAVLKSTICNVHARGIDEAYLKVPSYSQKEDEVLALVKAIKCNLNNLYNEHINCSIGIASNIWLSKMAASFHKPKGFFIIKKSDIPSFYKYLSLKNLNGVGYRLEKRFNMVQIFSPIDLYFSSWSVLSNQFGVNGQKWYLRIRGYEVDLDVFKHQKSLGHQVTLGQFKPSTKVEITTVVQKIAKVLAYRLRTKNLKAQSLYIDLLYLDNTNWNNKIEHVNYFNDNSTIINLSNMLLKKHKQIKPIKRISIYLGSLTPHSQLTFLTKDSFVSKTRDISDVIDSLKIRYSNKGVYSARDMFDRSFDLNRIGFAGDLIRETSENLQSKV